MKLENLKVLIVDDSKTMVRVISNVVSQLGIEKENIITAFDGKEGLEKFNQNKDLDIILSDINMPIMDGYGFVKNVRTMDKKIKIMFITTEGGRDSVIKGLKLGANGYIVKPFDAPTLKQKLKATLNLEN